MIAAAVRASYRPLRRRLPSRLPPPRASSARPTSPSSAAVRRRWPLSNAKSTTCRGSWARRCAQRTGVGRVPICPATRVALAASSTMASSTARPAVVDQPARVPGDAANQLVSDVLIIGGGVIGCGIAHALSTRGATVTMVDPRSGRRRRQPRLGRHARAVFGRAARPGAAGAGRPQSRAVRRPRADARRRGPGRSLYAHGIDRGRLRRRRRRGILDEAAAALARERASRASDSIAPSLRASEPSVSTSAVAGLKIPCAWGRGRAGAGLRAVALGGVTGRAPGPGSRASRLARPRRRCA